MTSIAWLRDNTNAAGTILLDARPTESYTGADDRGGTIKRPGHIPVATSLPYTSFFREDTTLKSTAEIEQMLAAPGSRQASGSSRTARRASRRPFPS